MKKKIFLTTIVLAMTIISLNARTVYGGPIDINVFFGALEPYGEWIEVGYDEYIWRPYKSDYNWRPYSVGRWEWTRHGWYWVSYEPFGWATFHYGRWYYDDYYGWVWMPDDIWAPAWVEWRYNDHYIGWSPLPPYARFHNRYGIRFSIGWHSNHIYWNFVKYNHFVSFNVHRYCIERNYVEKIYKKTKYRTNYFEDNKRIVNGGVSRKYVEKKIGRRLTTKSIARTDNFNEYNKREVKAGRGIVEYRPSENRTKSSTFDKSVIKKGRSLKSLNSDKVVINRRNIETKNERDAGGNIKKPEVEKSRDDEKKDSRKYNVPKEKELKKNNSGDIKKKSNERKTERGSDQSGVVKSNEGTKSNDIREKFRKENNGLDFTNQFSPKRTIKKTYDSKVERKRDSKKMIANKKKDDQVPTTMNYSKNTENKNQKRATVETKRNRDKA